jgi:serine O-acetyltransferase
MKATLYVAESNMTQISPSTPDWTRETQRAGTWDPGRSLLATIRRYQALEKKPKSFVQSMLKRLQVAKHRFWSVVTGADIPLNSQIGGGLIIPHPNGIVIHPKARIGPNCLIFQQVTIGVTTGEPPKIGGHVDIGAGAKILGPIVIGDNVKIGANATVLISLPAGCTAVGIPAKIIQGVLGDHTDQSK